MQAAQSLKLRIVDKGVVKSFVEQHIVLAGKSDEHRSKGFLVFMPEDGVRSRSAKEDDNSPGLEVSQNRRERCASDVWIGASQQSVPPSCKITALVPSGTARSNLARPFAAVS